MTGINVYKRMHLSNEVKLKADEVSAENVIDSGCCCFFFLVDFT